MTNRRRANRFILPRSGDAVLRLMQDVLIERITADGVDVLSEMPLRADETVILELPSGHGSRSAVQAEVDSDTPVSTGDLERHRVALRFGAIAAHGIDMAAVRRHLPAIGIVMQRMPVHIRDVSTSGCLLESLEALPAGHVGLLDLPDDVDPHSEAIRVCRVTHLIGAPRPWRRGAQFLALTAPSGASVRNVVARFEILNEVAVPREPSVRPGRRPGTVSGHGSHG
jgi:hypothetical protein